MTLSQGVTFSYPGGTASPEAGPGLARYCTTAPIIGIGSPNDPQATAAFRLGGSELALARLAASEWPWWLARARATGAEPGRPSTPEHV